jgi:2-octaprenyl-6-methoxyphenol hydroxylase
MEHLTPDIVISGGGVAGLTAACAFGVAGFSVLCVDPTAPVTDADSDGADLRTTAFLQPAVAVLTAAGLWDRLSPHAAALQVMRIVDAEPGAAGPHRVKDFDAAEISDLPFGWNLPNWLLRREMVARLGELPNVTLRPGIATTSLFTREGEARVTLSDGWRVTTRLVIAADGRDSQLRASSGIAVKTTRYGQKALSFAVSHPVPHDNISIEIHQSGGPFTLVPLPDRNRAPASAIVWMEAAAEADRLAALPVAAFDDAMTARSAGVLGPLHLITRRTAWPIISQIADRMAGERLALIAEAAHVMPPIGAQGLNMSLADIAALLSLAEARREGLGDAAMLDAYTRARHMDVALRVRGVDMLNRASMAGAPGLRRLRAGALDALYALGPVRKTLMKAGLGL